MLFPRFPPMQKHPGLQHHPSSELHRKCLINNHLYNKTVHIPVAYMEFMTIQIHKNETATITPKPLFGKKSKTSFIRGLQ